MPVTFSSKHGAAQFFPILRIAGQNGVRAPVALTKAVCLIGRHRGVHLPLPSEQVSKIHALLVKQRDGVYLRDLASRNGVFVNGHPIRETDLATGDVIRIGAYTLQCASGFAEANAGKPPGLHPAPAALESDDMSSHLALEGRAVLVGRRDECDVVLAAGEVSPVHCVLFELDGRRHVRDLDSAAGTFVNGQKIHQHELSPGDELRIGDTTLRYVEVQGEAEIPADAEGLAPHEDLLELGTGLQDVFGPAAGLDASHQDYDDVAGTGLSAVAPQEELEPSPEPEAEAPAPEAAKQEEHEEPDEELITLEVDPDHAEEEDHAPTVALTDEAEAEESISLQDEEGSSDAIPISPHRDDVDDHPELAHLDYEEEEEPDHPDTLTPAMLEEEAPPAPAAADAPQAQGSPAPAPIPPAPTEGLIPLVEGDRTVGVLDAAVQATAALWNAPFITPDALPSDEFISIPLVPVGGPDSAVGGLPLPPTHEGYGELEEPAHREGEAPSEPPVPTGEAASAAGLPGSQGEPTRPPLPQPEPEHEPLSPDETITPASGDDDLRGEVDPAAPLGPAAASGAPTHPLFGLVQELQAAHADHRALDHPMAEGSDEDLADLLKYDGADPVTPTAEHHETLRRTAVRKLDQLINDLSDLVTELKTTWQHVKLGRHHEPPAAADEGAKENPRN